LKAAAVPRWWRGGIRLRELDPVVDGFVLMEAVHTFAGLPKPLCFAENRARFEASANKIGHHIVDDMHDLSGAWRVRLETC
jgi:hypothetical protein